MASGQAVVTAWATGASLTAASVVLRVAGVAVVPSLTA